MGKSNQFLFLILESDINLFSLCSMPSTHSAVMGYYATYITLASSKLPIHPSLQSLPSALIYPLAPVAMISVSTIICPSRLRLGHHTLKQVVAGVTVGILCGAAWFAWWKDGNAPDIAWSLVDILPHSLQSWIR
jgi:membrane-associated phospholipid phosphatase